MEHSSSFHQQVLDNKIYTIENEIITLALEHLFPLKGSGKDNINMYKGNLLYNNNNSNLQTTSYENPYSGLLEYVTLSLQVVSPDPSQGDGGRMGAKYQWSPDPVLAVMVGVVTVIIVLIPAVCSICFHFHFKRTSRHNEKVTTWKMRKC